MGCCLFDCIGGCMLTIIRWLIFFINIVSFLAGIALIVIGAIILSNVGNLDYFYSQPTGIASIILVTAGSLLFIVSFLGCCGAVKKTPWMMNTYGSFLLILFALQLAGGVCAYVYKDYFISAPERTMEESARAYYVPGFGGSVAAKDAWDAMQTEYRCCGVRTPLDWFKLRPQLVGYPDSCKCEIGDFDCGNNGVFEDGCYDKLEPILISLVDAMGAVAIASSLIELIGAMFSFCLANSFKEERYLKATV